VIAAAAAFLGLGLRVFRSDHPDFGMIRFGVRQSDFVAGVPAGTTAFGWISQSVTMLNVGLEPIL
jgi:hypothetical protein